MKENNNRTDDRDIRENHTDGPHPDTSLKIMFWATIGIICVVIAELAYQVLRDIIQTI